MASQQLPDEIIKEIVAPALQVSDHAFINTEKISPFATYTESTSAILLVCKGWLRVSTPLLYNVVVLRSTAQTRALARALTANPLLGSFIRKLRLEGGFGQPVETIVRLGPNITELCITLEIYSSDHTVGLCRALPMMDLKRLIICDAAYDNIYKNQQLSNLYRALSICVKTWKSLTVVDLPYVGHDHGARINHISQIMAEAPYVKTLNLRHPQRSKHLIESLAKCPSLEVIRVIPQGTDEITAMNETRRFALKLGKEQDRLSNLLRVEYPETR
ncbi:hypothetical protein H0H81_012361 [Sphagnurus paluster]|uniref:F-box domain-containing protein n=1 Tax=Sphagnurus paluster TaxID=117069 RepID=A0A9P7GMU7_9AGAR|nr:hypothetical protein H0H81_012361 [Sphagnurus paluster]